MAFYEGQKFAKELCEALGIDPANVRSLEIVCRAGEVAYADVKMFVPPEKSGAVKEVLKHYKLVLKEE